MLPPRPIVGFLCKFALAYGLLIAPWPGWNTTYARCFRAAGNLVFARENGPRLLQFEAQPEKTRLLDTRILLANREVTDKNGNTPAKYLELDSRAVGWIPTAVMVALMLSTPTTWSRKIVGSIGGLLAVQGFIFLSMAGYIWNNSVSLGLLTLSPFAKRITSGLEETLITQMGASFVVPVSIWILIVLSGSDFVAHRLHSAWFARERALETATGK